MFDILSGLKADLRPSKIFSEAGISSKDGKITLNKLISHGYVNNKLSLTGKGIEFIRKYDVIDSFISKYRL